MCSRAFFTAELPASLRTRRGVSAAQRPAPPTQATPTPSQGQFPGATRPAADGGGPPLHRETP